MDGRKKGSKTARERNPDGRDRHFHGETRPTRQYHLGNPNNLANGTCNTRPRLNVHDQPGIIDDPRPLSPRSHQQRPTLRPNILLSLFRAPVKRSRILHPPRKRFTNRGTSQKQRNRNSHCNSKQSSPEHREPSQLRTDIHNNRRPSRGHRRSPPSYPADETKTYPSNNNYSSRQSSNYTTASLRRLLGYR